MSRWWKTNKGRGRLRLQNLHRFRDEVLQGHHAWIAVRAARREIGHNGGRDDFENFDRRALKLNPERLRVGMQGRLGRRISGRCREGNEAQSGGHINDGRTRLLLQVRQKCRRQAERAKQIRADDGLRIGHPGRPEILRPHDACVIDHDIQRGMAFNHLRRERTDIFGIINIERDRRHPGIGVGSFIEDLLTSAGDDDLVAQGVKSFGEAPPDAGTAAGDKNGVFSEFHSMSALMYPADTMLSMETCCNFSRDRVS